MFTTAHSYVKYIFINPVRLLLQDIRGKYFDRVFILLTNKNVNQYTWRC